MELKRQYIVDEANQKVAVQLDIATFEKIENVLENFALVQLMNDDDKSRMASTRPKMMGWFGRCLTAEKESTAFLKRGTVIYLVSMAASKNMNK